MAVKSSFLRDFHLISGPFFLACVTSFSRCDGENAQILPLRQSEKENRNSSNIFCSSKNALIFFIPKLSARECENGLA